MHFNLTNIKVLLLGVSMTLGSSVTAQNISLQISNNSLDENGGEATVTATSYSFLTPEIQVELSFSGTATSGVDYTASDTNIIIPRGSYNGSITLTSIADNIFEGDETIVIAIESVDNGAIGFPSRVTATITDDESPPVVTLGASPLILEEDDTSTLTATLDNATDEDVVVTVATNDISSNPDDYTLSSNTITIAAGLTSGTATLMALDDDDHAELEISISGVSGGSASIGNPRSVTIILSDEDNDEDEDSPVVTLTASPLTIEEGETTTLTATLGNATDEDVEVRLVTNDISTNPADYTLSSNTITIAEGLTSGHATLEARENGGYEGNEDVEVYLSEVSDGSAFIGTPRTVTITIMEKQEPPAVTLSASPLTIEEDETTTLTATLSHATNENVEITLETNDISTRPDDYNLSSNTITIASGQTAGTATLAAIEDDIYEGDENVEVSISGVSGGLTFIGSPRAISITILDNQSPPTVSLSASPVSIPENGSSTITATLSNATYENVLIVIEPTNITTSDQDYNLGATSILVPAGDLSGSTTLDAIPDDTYEGDEEVRVTIAAIAGGSATFDDDESVLINIEDAQSPPSVSLELTGSTFSENGGTAAVNIHLSHISFRDVQVEFSYTGTARAADYSGASSSVNIPAGTTGETILLTGVDNLEADGNRTIIISIVAVTNATIGENNSVTATILDDDTAGISPIISDAGTMTSESGSNDTFEIVLNSRPASDVVFEITGLDTTEGQLGTHDLTFTRNNWDQSRVVTVTGVDDDEVDGDIRYTLTIAVIDELSDNSYHGLSTTVDIINTDNDTAELIVTPEDASLQTSENGTSDSFSLELSAQPASNVVINIAGRDETEGTLDMDELTFTPGNWNQPRTVTVTGVNDNLVDGDISYTLKLTVVENRSDENFHGLSATIDVLNADIDTAEQENQPPLPADDEFEIDQDTTLSGSSLLSNDIDPDGDELTINTIPVIFPSNGSLVINEDGTFSYTPDNDFFGTDSFTYEVCDNGTPSRCNTAMVTINVTKATTELEVRNGFSPQHGNYIIPWLNQYDKVSLVVFNRWGNVVYRQDKYENNWNGESNKGFSIGNKLPVGTYYYVITIADNNKRLNGYIYLTR